jgi:DNA-binding CsgD family transcriptional regulator
LEDEVKTHYERQLEKLTVLLGSQRSVARALGINHGTITHRRANPATVKREHELAAEALLARILG